MQPKTKPTKNKLKKVRKTSTKAKAAVHRTRGRIVAKKKTSTNTDIKSDLKRIDAMKDENIDYSDIPPLDDDFFAKAIIIYPTKKDSITLRVDHDVLLWFKDHGKGYQTRMNAVLKTYVAAQEKHVAN